jgi:hypothetical protein
MIRESKDPKYLMPMDGQGTVKKTFHLLYFFDLLLSYYLPLDTPGEIFAKSCLGSCPKITYPELRSIPAIIKNL